MKKLLLLLLLLPTFLFSQSKIGLDIDGERDFDESGSSVSLSIDGNIVAIGAPHNDGPVNPNGSLGIGADLGQVRIYQWDSISVSWIQLGQDIEGEAPNDFSGSSVSLSDDGTVVAIGAPNADINGNESGQVRVFNWDGNSWIQLGQDIDGESTGDHSGSSVSINSIGNIVAIGAPNNIGLNNQSGIGHVRIYQWDSISISWVQLGQDIDGEGSGDYSGRSVSLSSDGQIVAIGADHNTNINNISGHVRIYQWDPISTSWVQLGQDIDGVATNDDCGRDVSLSSDGSILAVSSPHNDGNGIQSGQVRIFEWDPISSSWIQLGQDIYGEAAYDISGQTVSLNTEGNIVAIGAHYNSGNGYASGHVRIYQWDSISTSWVQWGYDIDGEASSDFSANLQGLSISGDGHRIAIGALYNDGGSSSNVNRGHVRIYGFISGCMDPNFVEYNPFAIINDSSCVTPIIYGCTDSISVTYNSSANTDNGSCCYTSSSINSIGGFGGGDYSSLSMTYDGNRVAIGSGNSDQVLVTEWNGSSWQQVGNQITPQLNISSIHNFGSFVSISGDGNVVAVASMSDGYWSCCTDFEIYEWNGVNWVFVYSDNSASSTGDLSLDYDGNCLVVGSVGYYPNNIDGSVEIFYRDNGTWNLEHTLSGSHTYSVDIDSSGTRVVAGNHTNLQVLERNSGSTWSILGSSISRSGTCGNSGGFGYKASISADGNRVAGAGSCDLNNASGNTGIAEVYEYINGIGNWQQLGQSVYGYPNSSSSYISLSGDANRFILGGGPSGNCIVIYENISGNWTDIGSYVNGNSNSYFGTTTDMNYNGTMFMAGGQYGNSGTGSQVFKFNSECPSGCTDSLGLNYDPVAIYDDGSCCYDCGRIEGFIYEDADTSATYDSIVETPLGPQIIQLEKSSGELSYLTSQTDGYYSFVVDTGQQVITYSPPAFWQSTNQTQYSIDIQTDSTYSGLDFGIIPEFTKGDMTVDLTTSSFVCNNTATLWLTVRNLGTETITNVDLDLWVNNTSPISSASGGGTISGNHVYWNLSGDFYPFVYTGQEQSFSVTVQVPGGGSSLIDSARVTPVQFNLIEVDSTNNYAETSNSVLCSFDPNDKQVFPNKCFYEESDTLDYTIRFQNTGNYHATTVRLVDSLDLEKLDIMSFQVLGASHDYEWSLKVPSVLEVIFDSIMLVDSSVSFNESQGFFKYRIIVRDSLPDLQPTATPAFIYFDLNAPVVTNLPEVNFVSNFSASVQSTDISCNGANDGTATLNIASGTSPYMVNWDNGDTALTINNLYQGTYSVTLTDSKNCTYSSSVTIIEPSAITSSNPQTICNGQSISVGNNTYATSGTYTDVLTALNGCDSTITTNLTVLPNVTSTINETACNSYTWNGQTYTQSGSYTYTTTNVNGCDSTATLNLTISPATSNLTVKTTCDDYTWSVTSQTYTTSGTYTNVTTNANGCVHTDSLILMINNSTSSTTNESDCNSYTWNGQTYNTSGTYSWIGTNTVGCDSTATLNLTINSPSSSTTNTSSCDSYNWNGQTYTTSGNYTYTTLNANGCDSTATLNLTINTGYSLNVNRSICFGESITVGNNTYDQSGTYTDQLTTVNGCDSIITLNLTVYSDIVSTLSQSGNDIVANTVGGTAPYIYQWNTGETSNQITPTANGDYWVIITDANGCVSDTSFINVEWVSTSIEDLNIDKLTIYPNPSEDIFNIEFTSLLRQDLEVRIINSIGEIVYRDNVNNHIGQYSNSISLEQYSKAIYFLEIQTDDGIVNKKLILQ